MHSCSGHFPVSPSPSLSHSNLLCLSSPLFLFISPSHSLSSSSKFLASSNNHILQLLPVVCVVFFRGYVPTGLDYCWPFSEPRTRWRTRSSSETQRDSTRNRLRNIASPSTTLTGSVGASSPPPSLILSLSLSLFSSLTTPLLSSALFFCCP